VFVTLEGIEGCGKSTQCRLLAERLEGLGLRVLVTREPGGSELGQTLRRILLSVESADLTRESELFLYLADRSQHVGRTIRPHLDQGGTVLCDRYADSTVAYQGYGRGMDPELLHSLNEVAVGGLWPDLTLLIDLPVEDGLGRAMARNREQSTSASEGRFEAESLAFHGRVRQGYLMLAARHPGRFRIIDGTGTPEEVHRRVWEAAERFMEKTGRQA
jgi:dTMP kinase